VTRLYKIANFRSKIIKQNVLYALIGNSTSTILRSKNV
jgi:hypothetical protein